MRCFGVLALVIGLAGCASRPVVYYHVSKGDKVVAPISEDGVRFQETIKAYSLGRYRDPHHPRMMHERHLAYRVEEDSTWDYSPKSVSLSNKESNPNIFQAADTEVELKKQQDHNALLTDQNKMLLQKLDKVKQINQQVERLAKENKALQEALDQSRREAEGLKNNLETQFQAQPVVEPPKKKGALEKLFSLLPNKN